MMVGKKSWWSFMYVCMLLFLVVIPSLICVCMGLSFCSGLYGATFGGQFLSRVDKAERTNGSPFYVVLPHLNETNQNMHEYSMTKEESEEYTKRQQLPLFGSFPLSVREHKEITLPTKAA